MTLDRRFFLKAIGAIGLSTSIHKSNAAPQEANQNQDFSFESQPYLQNFTADNISVFAIFNKPCLAWLEIIGTDGNTQKMIYQSEDGMRNANTTLFRFTVPHGSRDFQYRIQAKEVTKFDPYKITYGKEISSQIFTTQLPFPKTSDTYVLILNDIHENTKTYKELYEKSTLPRKDLVVLNGDTFHYVTKQEDLTKKLFKPITEQFASKTPFIMLRGNHETRGSFSRDYKKYFDFPGNKFYQAYSMGDTFMILLDGGEDKPDTHEVYANTVDYDNYRLEQKEWLAKVLASKERKKAKHTVVVTHIPFWHSDEWHGTLHNRSCFHELLQKNKISAVISGHTHQSGFYPPDKDHNYYVVIGGGPKEGQRTFVEVISNNKSLSVSLKKDNGQEIGSFKKG